MSGGRKSGIEGFAEGHGLAFSVLADLPRDGATLSAADTDEIGAGARGALPGGLEGTIAHFDYTTRNDDRTVHHPMTVVVTRVPETIGFVPALVFDGAGSDVRRPIGGPRPVRSFEVPELSHGSVTVFEGASDGWLHELFSPGLCEWLNRSADDFGFELADGVLLVARNGHLEDGAELERLCEDAAYVARALREESLEDARTGGTETAGARKPSKPQDVMLANAMAAIELEHSPGSVSEAQPAFRRLIAGSIPTWIFLAGLAGIYTLVLNIPGIALPIILISEDQLGLLLAIEAAIYAVVFFFTARSHIRNNAKLYATEAFYRAYASDRGYELTEPLAFAAFHAEANLPFAPDRAMTGAIAGLPGAPGLIVRGDGSKREDGIALVAGPRGPVASAELRASPGGISASDLDAYAERLAGELRAAA